MARVFSPAGLLVAKTTESANANFCLFRWEKPATCQYIEFRKLFIRNPVAANPLITASEKKLSNDCVFQRQPVSVRGALVGKK